MWAFLIGTKILLGIPGHSRALQGRPGDSWGLQGTPGHSLGLQRRHGDFWGFLGTPGEAWGLLGTSRDSRGGLGIPGDSWVLLGTPKGGLGTPGDSKAVLGTAAEAWALLGAPGDSWGLLGILGRIFCKKCYNFWFQKWVHFLVPEMGTSFYVSKGRTQKWVPNMSPFLEPENSDFGCRASVKYMIRSKLTNHVHKDCIYQAHMSCNTAPCLEVLQGF